VIKKAHYWAVKIQPKWVVTAGKRTNMNNIEVNIGKKTVS
jgi:hypothetical protein